MSRTNAQINFSRNSYLFTMKQVSVLEVFLTICHVFCIFRNKTKIYNNGNNIKFVRANTMCYVLRIIVFLSIISISMYFVCALKDFATLEATVFTFCSAFTVLIIIQLYMDSIINQQSIEKYLRKLFQTNFKIVALHRLENDVVMSPKTKLNTAIFSIAILGLYMFLIYSFQFDLLTGIIYNIGYTTPKFIITANTMIFVNCLIILYHNFQMLCRYTSSTNELEKIVESVDIYCKLIRLSTEINGCFGYQNLTIVAYYVIWNAYKMYDLVIVLLQNQITYENIQIIHFTSSWVSTNTLILFLICVVCQCVKEESKKFKQKLWHLATIMDNKVLKFS